MKVDLSSHDHEVAFQDLYPGFLKRPYLQRSVKMATRGDPLKIEAKSPRTWGKDLGFRLGPVGTRKGYLAPPSVGPRTPLPNYSTNMKWEKNTEKIGFGKIQKGK